MFLFYRSMAMLCSCSKVGRGFRACFHSGPDFRGIVTARANTLKAVPEQTAQGAPAIIQICGLPPQLWLSGVQYYAYKDLQGKLVSASRSSIARWQRGLQVRRTRQANQITTFSPLGLNKNGQWAMGNGQGGSATTSCVRRVPNKHFFC
jgi:hypothetical protein